MVRETDRLLGPDPGKGGYRQQDGKKRLSKSNHKTNLTSFGNFLNYYTKAPLANH